MTDWVLAEHERMLANLIRIGTVSGIKPETAQIKVMIGEVETDWVQWATARAGSTRTWSCPSVGEQVIVLCPFGDLAQAIPALGLYQDARPAPAVSAGVEKVCFSDGSSVEYNVSNHSLTVNAAGGHVAVNAGSIQLNATGSVEINSTSLKHNGKNIGDSHTHGGVSPGGSQTSPPL